ncbi:MAG: YHYH protein [Solirubrobacteraceae bacterium]
MRPLMLLSAMALVGCGTAAATTLDKTKLPLGDQKTATAPKQGSLYSCQQTFDTNAPGAGTKGPWIDGDTWDMTQKLSVAGSVSHDAVFKVRIAGGRTLVTGNGLPSISGTFPVAASDPAYQYDRNPNSIRSYTLSVSLPASPERAATASCAGGTVGVTTKGIAIFSAFDAGGRDAMANELQDKCGGHPQVAGQYHFHGFSACAKKTGLWGYALDGFGIYGPRTASGTTLTTADLDACHGITSSVKWRGKYRRIYHYVATDDFPYTVGCFRGTPITSATGLGIGRPG